MILSELYKALLTRITGLADVKHLAYNRGQLETDEDFDHLQFPAVLVEFLPFEPKAMGQKRQGADMQIVLTIASEVVQNTDARETDTIRNLGLAHMVLLDNIHALLQGWNGLGLTPTVNFNALNRTGFSPYDGVAGLENGMLMVHTMTYTTRIIDDAALVMYELMSPQPGLEINGVYYAPIIPPTDPDPPTPPETHVIEIIAGDGIDVDATDPERPIVSATAIGGGVQVIQEGPGISVNDTDPQNPIVINDGVLSVTGGDGVSVDNTDPQNPVVSIPWNPKMMTVAEGWFTETQFNSSSSGSWGAIIGVSGTGTGAAANSGIVSTWLGASDINTRAGGWFFTPGSTSTGKVFIYTDEQNMRAIEGLFVIETNITLGDLATVGNDYVFVMGLGSSNNSVNPNSGVYFKYNRSSNTNWQCITRLGGVETITNTAIPVNADQYYILRIEVNHATTEVKFYIDGFLVATHTTNVISNQAVGLLIMMEKTSGTTTLYFMLDYYWAYQKYYTPRVFNGYASLSGY